MFEKIYILKFHIRKNSDRRNTMPHFIKICKRNAVKTNLAHTKESQNDRNGLSDLCPPFSTIARQVPS